MRVGGALVPGRSTQLTWMFEGKADRIRRLVLRIEGREEARYRQGTNTYTAKNVFFSQVIREETSTYAIRSGSASLAMPEGTMHSFDGGNNKIIWALSIEGDIPRWPDVKEEFILTVRPEGMAR